MPTPIDAIDPAKVNGVVFTVPNTPFIAELLLPDSYLNAALYMVFANATTPELYDAIATLLAITWLSNDFVLAFLTICTLSLLADVIWKTRNAEVAWKSRISNSA